MHWSGAIAVLNFAANVIAQGSYGGDQSSCTSATPWQYAGCYNTGNSGRHANFPWQLSTGSGDAKSYPGYTSTITVDICLTGCRGHGWKYAALFYGTECYCASTFPNPDPPTSGSTASGPGIPEGSNPTQQVAGSQCSSTCNGNPSQICGGGDAASLYVDTSFVNDTTPATRGAASNFNYLGCFNTNGAGPMYVSIKTPNTFSCENYCGSLGYSFAARSGIDSNTGATTCGCGSEIQAGLQVSESSCNFYCNGSQTAA